MPSPDNGSKAVVIVENCGATTPYVTAVYLVHYNQTLDPESRDFFFAVKGRNDINVVWNENFYFHNAVLFKVLYQPPEEIYRQATVWNRERFEYEEQP